MESFCSDFSGNIANSMEEATRNKPAKTKMYNSKKAVTKVKKICTKKSSKALIKTAARKTKESMILEKSETKYKYSMDDSARKYSHHLSTCLRKLLKSVQNLLRNLEKLSTLKKQFQIMNCIQMSMASKLLEN